MYWQSSYGLPTLDCNLYSQAYSPIGTNPGHLMPFSITCAARSCQQSRDPAPSTEHVRDRIASVGRLFGNRRRTEWRSVRAVACSDDLQGGGALGDALTPGTPAGSMAASAHGGTYSHVAVVGGASGGERGAASATAAAAARRRRAAPTGEAVTPPRSAPAHGGQGGRHGALAGGWD